MNELLGAVVLTVLAGVCVYAFCDFERSLRVRVAEDTGLDLDEVLMLPVRYLARQGARR